MNLDSLKRELDAHHVILSISEAGRLKYNAPGPVPVALVELLKEHKTELLEELKTAENMAFSHDLSAPDWAALSLEAGRCGSCARFTPASDWGPYMGTCSAPARAWWPEQAPLSIHLAYACPLEGGVGYLPSGEARR